MLLGSCDCSGCAVSATCWSSSRLQSQCTVQYILVSGCALTSLSPSFPASLSPCLPLSLLSCLPLSLLPYLPLSLLPCLPLSLLPYLPLSLLPCLPLSLLPCLPLSPLSLLPCLPLSPFSLLPYLSLSTPSITTSVQDWHPSNRMTRSIENSMTMLILRAVCFVFTPTLCTITRFIAVSIT